MASSSSPSSRWCPTQEQVMILEEIYNKGGIKTPNAFQIQQITTHLSFYGKIEGKNVFYWFQNHKARERQKLRRKLMQNQKHLQLSLHQHRPASWYHYSLPPAALTSSFQGGRAEGAPQPRIWPSMIGINSWVNRLSHHDHILKDKPSPLYSTRQPPLKTLELFPLKSSHLNLNQDPTSSS